MGRNIRTYAPPVLSERERDYQLAGEALRGSTEAWDTLYQEAHTAVLQNLPQFDDQHFFSHEDYHDIADEAFERCYGHLSRYQGLSRFRYWVLGYAKNIMLDRRRRQMTQYRNQYLMQVMVSSQISASDPLCVLLRLERDRFLWEAFFLLCPRDRFILGQYLFARIPPRTIAKALHLTRKQVLAYYEEALIAVRWHFIRLYAGTAVNRL